MRESEAVKKYCPYRFERVGADPSALCSGSHCVAWRQLIDHTLDESLGKFFILTPSDPKLPECDEDQYWRSIVRETRGGNLISERFELTRMANAGYCKRLGL